MRPLESHFHASRRPHARRGPLASVPRPARESRRARGSIYALVLATVCVAVAIVLGGLEYTALAGRKAALVGDIGGARGLAVSAVDQAAAVLASDANWRTTFAAGAVTLPVTTLSGGSMSATISDPADGLLANDTEQDIVLTGTGTLGRARQRVETTLRPTPRAFEAMAYAAHSASTMSLGGTIVASEPLRAVGNVAASSARVGPPVISSGTISGSLYLNTTTSSAPSVTRPTSAAITYWQSRGVVIDINSIPSTTIENTYLLPTFNPYPPYTASSVYVINCAGKNLTIKNCRITSTLVLINPGNRTNLTNGVSLEAPAGQPALLATGPIDLNLTRSTVSDTEIQVTVLGLGNVLGGLGISGNTYTSRVKGLVYATGAVALRGITRVDGCLLTDGVLTVSDTPVIAHDATLVSSPPRGFWEGLDLRVVDGSWKQAVDP